MDMSKLVIALAPAFAAGFALQRLLEILDPIFDQIKNGKYKKIVLGLISFAAGLGLVTWPKVRILTQLVAPDSVPSILDYLVTALIVSGGTEGFNAILKFVDYKKQESKASAVTKTLRAEDETAAMTANRALMAPLGKGEIMSELSDNLVRVINRWSDIETPGFDSAIVLKELWDESHLNTIDFDPQGIDDLIRALKRDRFFKDRPRTAQLKHGFFIAGGGISNEGELLDFYDV